MSEGGVPPDSTGGPPGSADGVPAGGEHGVPPGGDGGPPAEYGVPLGSQWYDAEAGPLVRPYAVTGGRTQPGPTGVRFDLIALVAADDCADDRQGEALLGPEHRALLALCREEIQSVAELSADADLPVGVVRVLLGDLLEAGCVRVSRPVPPALLPDERILREVIDGLRAL
ncbi:DUF742 domain-containing protein [Streptomyces sp. NPDC057287]|uniref:DUF742 domain-containing protein n=1 Tax=Streptomyces sp. NPDC057287 TaxID=3346086 RepID=UPI003627E9D8